MCRPPVLKWLVLHTLLMPILAMRVRVHRNPVTRVTDLLERLKDKVEKQGADEAKLWEKMQCNCKKTTTNLQKNIEQEETRLPMLRSDHSALGAQKARLVAEKERAVADRTDAQTALSSAEELRQKEATDYTKLKEETQKTQKNLAAIGKAIAAIEKGLSGSFLQTDEAEELRQVVSTANLRLSDWDALAALLAGEMPQSSSIVGVLQSMRDSMEEDQSSAESREAGAKSAFDGMATAKRSQISTLASEIEVKTSRIGELSVDMVNKQQAMDSSAKKLQDDSKLLADTKETCDQQEEDWQARSQSRADEMHAIQETLSLLGDEQAREIFRKAMPSSTPSFLQVSESEAGEPQLALLASAMRSGNIDFKKIQDKITEMIHMLKQEQMGADRKFKWCKAELRSSKETAETLEQSGEDLTKIMEEVKADQLQAQQDVAALTKNIQELDQQMDDGLKQRQSENVEYKEAFATDQRAIDLLQRGKERLASFYVSEKPKKSLLAQHRLLRARSQGISGLQVASESSSVLPEGFGAYQKQPGDAVLGMLDKIVVDINKDMKALEKQEKDAQLAYEKGTKDAQKAREEATRSLAEKSGVKAGLEKRFQGLQVKQTSNAEGKENAEKYLKALKEECDDRGKNYQASKASNLARQNRLDSAKTLLAPS